MKAWAKWMSVSLESIFSLFATKGYDDDDEERTFYRRGVRDYDSSNADKDYYRNSDRKNRKDSYREYAEEDWKCLEVIILID